MASGGLPVLAIDIGGTKVAAALVAGARVVSRTRYDTPASAGPAAVAGVAIAAARAVLSSVEDEPMALGVACAGVVQDGRVRAMSPELLPGWHDFELAATLSENLALPVVAVNDAQAAAYGEWRHGAGAGRSSMLFVTVSTGVGGGLVLGGRLWSGATGVAGHVGHMHGGEVERLASGTALARRAAEAGHGGMDARRVIELAQGGAAWASALVRDGVDALARALADVRLLADPELVVLGGGVGLNPYFREALRRGLAEAVPAAGVEVAGAQLGADAGLVGAAALAGEAVA